MVLGLLLTKFPSAVPVANISAKSPVKEREFFYLSIEKLVSGV